MRKDDLREILNRIDHRGYPAYKDTKGRYDWGSYTLSIDHVQGDPFAAPSRLSIYIEGKDAGFDPALYETPSRKVTLEDTILRQFGREIRRFDGEAHGSGKSGLIGVSRPGQEILPRSACQVNPANGSLIIRFQVGFPARGRTVLADELIRILFDYLPKCVEKSLFQRAYIGSRQERGASSDSGNVSPATDRSVSQKDSGFPADIPDTLTRAAALADDQDYARRELKTRGLICFVADGSILPRKSGISSLPMKDAIPFKSPDSMAVKFDFPHRGRVRGMGIPEGITLIVGGGYHGKSTLLSALELGVYNHIAGDGRELVITEDTAVKLRAEDGRSIQNTDISAFIRNLPNGKDTVHFSTEDASGSTSQAASTVEAIESGAKSFLIDEDTSATNFMIRDELMQKVVSRDEEPIIPFIDRVEELYEKHGISTILVAGSSGSYFHKASRVIQMKQYLPMDITERAQEEAAAYPLKSTGTLPPASFDTKRRVTAMLGSGGGAGDSGRDAGGDGNNKDNRRGGDRGYRGHGRQNGGHDRGERIKTKTQGTDGFSVNKEQVELRYIEQLVDREQVDALSQILVYLSKHTFDGRKTVTDAVEWLYGQIESKGFAAFGAEDSDHMAIPRKQEIYEMLNRCRNLIRIT